MSYTIKKIQVFPFKSLKGIEVEECLIDEHGFKSDRIYMLVTKSANGWTAVTQRSYPSSARIAQELAGDHLVLSYVDQQSQKHSLNLPLDVSTWSQDLPKITMELWDFPMTCWDVGNAEIMNFFTEFFKDANVKKLKASEEMTIVASNVRRKVPETDELLNADIRRDVTSSFQDIFPGSLMTTSSYEDLSRHVHFLDEEASIKMDSFRMNLIIETEEPWVEDDWKSFKINNHVWAVQGPSERCSMPAVDQALGLTRKNRHPLPSSNRFRISEKGHTPCFGINIVNKDWGYKIKVGDVVTSVKSD